MRKKICSNKKWGNKVKNPKFNKTNKNGAKKQKS